MMFRSIGNGIGGCLGNGYFGGGYGLMNGGWGMIIMMAITVIAAGAVIILALRSANKRTADHAALDALKLRFAAGEITEEEYLKKKTILK